MPLPFKLAKKKDMSIAELKAESEKYDREVDEISALMVKYRNTESYGKLSAARAIAESQRLDVDVQRREKMRKTSSNKKGGNKLLRRTVKRTKMDRRRRR